jgi:drug/metabolite transporter (DMT)-like permease
MEASRTSPTNGAGFYMGVMLITGACNTLLMKFMCLQVASPGVGLATRAFDFPFFQTMLMMLGELLCLGAFTLTSASKTARPDFPKWIMVLPVICDWSATTLVNAAYVILPASTIQMCRGCIVLFTCLFSVVFLGRRQEIYHYVGVVLVAIGITIVSLQALLEPSAVSNVAHAEPAYIGISLVIGAQLFQASMLVIEEKYLSKYEVPPLQMVGLEGLFGSIFGILLLLNLQHWNIENSMEAMNMISSSTALQLAVGGSILSIAFFNWSGVSVTMSASAVARSTIDVSRTALVWTVELALLWNTFSWMQLVGFAVLIVGTLTYNAIIRLPFVPLPEGASRPLTADNKDTEA